MTNTTSLISFEGNLVDSNGITKMLTFPDLNIFSFDESVEKFFEDNAIKNTQGLMNIILLMYAFGNSSDIQYLLIEGYKRGLLNKGSLLTLYRLQTKENRERNPFITLTMLWNIPTQAFQKNSKSELVPALVFSREEILLIAEQTISLSYADLDLFFKYWFYQSNTPIPLSKKFFEYWFSETGNMFCRIDGKIASLIAIAYHQTHPEMITLEEVLTRFKHLSNHKPESHGSIRYLSLAFEIAGEDIVKRRLVLDTWIQAIIRMIVGGKSLFQGAQLSIEMLLREKNITPEEKSTAVKQLQRVADSTAESYSNLIKDAKKNVEEI